jgi:hypothetical protein
LTQAIKGVMYDRIQDVRNGRWEQQEELKRILEMKARGIPVSRRRGGWLCV